MFTSKSLWALAAFLLATPLMVAAGPFPNIPRALPAGTVRMAFDESNNKLLAYDASGKMLGQVEPNSMARNHQKRAAGSCVTLSSDDVQKLPGWSKLDDQAKKNWGKGSRNIVTNDKDLPDSPAQMCVDSSPIVVQKDGQPQCTKSIQATDGKLSENGSVTLQFSQGTVYSFTNTVTKESSIAIGTSVSAKFSFEGLFDLGTEVTTTGTFTNTLSNAVSSSSSSTATSSTTMPAPAGKQCHLEFTNQACNIQGKGKVPFIATGWVWFEYDNKVDGHYKWSLSIDQTLPNVDDRSTFAEFQSSVASTTKSQFHGTCDK